jgi:hypothetical protein
MFKLFLLILYMWYSCNVFSFFCVRIISIVSVMVPYVCCC